MPPFSLPRLGSIVPFLYKHVGVHLQLYDNRPPKLTYAANGRSSITSVLENFIVPSSISFSNVTQSWIPNQITRWNPFSRWFNLHKASVYCERLDLLKPVPSASTLVLQAFYRPFFGQQRQETETQAMEPGEGMKAIEPGKFLESVEEKELDDLYADEAFVGQYRNV
jgi:hypothetical protein